MTTIKLFYFIFCLLLLSINCEIIKVGFGNHSLLNNETVVLIKGSKIIQSNLNETNIGEYPECINELNDEEIILIYNESIKRKGCTVDLITKNDFIEFNVLINLTYCDLCDITTGYNKIILPFAYSLNIKEFERISEGPLYGEDNATCPDREKCKSMGSKYKKDLDCMPFTGLEFLWTCYIDNSFWSLLTFLSPIGDFEEITMFTGSISNELTALKFNIKINEDTKINIDNLSIFVNNTWISININYVKQNNNEFNCINEIIKPKMWKIIENEQFKGNKLLTFNLFPLKASLYKGEKECNNIKIIFSQKNYSLLIIEPKMEENIEETTNNIQTTTFNYNKLITQIDTTEKIIINKPNIGENKTTTNNNNIEETTILIENNITTINTTMFSELSTTLNNNLITTNQQKQQTIIIFKFNNSQIIKSVKPKDGIINAIIMFIVIILLIGFSIGYFFYLKRKAKDKIEKEFNQTKSSENDQINEDKDEDDENEDEEKESAEEKKKRKGKVNKEEDDENENEKEEQKGKKEKGNKKEEEEEEKEKEENTLDKTQNDEDEEEEETEEMEKLKKKKNNRLKIDKTQREEEINKKKEKENN